MEIEENGQKQGSNLQGWFSSRSKSQTVEQHCLSLVGSMLWRIQAVVVQQSTNGGFLMIPFFFCFYLKKEIATDYNKYIFVFGFLMPKGWSFENYSFVAYL